MSGNRKLVIEILGDAKDGAKALMDIRGHSEKMADGLQKAGTIGLTAGTALAGGLMWAAQQSEEAETQSRKLDNSIANSSSTFKENGQALRDLAQDLQGKTAADGDAIVGAEALMVQMGLTEDQVTSLTPLVVDLSRKMGVDLDVAAKAVSKSVDGSSTALKKMAIDVDATKMATDPLTATVDALRGSVQGYAEVEGQSFSGQLERTKNQLGDIVEGVGAGAISVFGGITDKLSGVMGAASGANPEIGNTVGKLGAIGAISSIAIGGLSVAAGWVLKMRDNFTTMNGEGDNATRTLNGVGKAAALIGGATAAVTVIEGVFTALNASEGVAGREAEGLDKLKLALADTAGSSKDVVAAFGEMVGAEQDTLRVQNLWEEFGAEVSIVGTGVQADVEQVQRSFDKMGDTQGPQAQLDVLNALEEQTQSLDHNSDQYKTNMEFIKKNRDAVEQHVAAVKADTTAKKDDTSAQQDQTSALQEYTDSLRATFDPMFAVMDAGEKLTDSQDKVAAAQDKVNFLAAVGASGSKEYKDAVKELDRAQTDQVKAALGLDDALGKLTTSVQNGEVSVDDAKAALQRWVAEGKITQAEADLTANKFQVAGVAAMDLDSKSVDIPVDASDQNWWTKAFKIGAQRFDGKNVDINGNDNPFWGKVGGIVNRQNVGTVSIDINGNPNPFWGKVGNVLAGKRAAGGPVEEGQAYLVGERGPEILVAPRDGTIIPNNRLAGRASDLTPIGGGATGAGAGSVTNYVYLQVDASGNPDPGRFVDQVWDALTTKIRTSGATLPASAIGS